MVGNFWGGHGQKWLWPVWRQYSKIDGINWFFDTDLQKLEADQKFFWWTCSKIGVASMATGL